MHSLTEWQDPLSNPRAASSQRGFYAARPREQVPERPPTARARGQSPGYPRFVEEVLSGGNTHDEVVRVVVLPCGAPRGRGRRACIPCCNILKPRTTPELLVCTVWTAADERSFSSLTV